MSSTPVDRQADHLGCDNESTRIFVRWVCVRGEDRGERSGGGEERREKEDSEGQPAGEGRQDGREDPLVRKLCWGGA